MQDVSRRVSAPVTRPARDRGLEAEVGKAEGQPPLRGQRPRSLRSLFGKLFASSSANPRPPPAPGRAPPAKDPDLTDDHSVPVMVFRKCQRELSNLGVVQDIKAHEGELSLPLARIGGLQGTCVLRVCQQCLQVPSGR